MWSEFDKSSQNFKVVKLQTCLYGLFVILWGFDHVGATLVVALDWAGTRPAPTNPKFFEASLHVDGGLLRNLKYHAIASAKQLWEKSFLFQKTPTCGEYEF